MFHMSYFAAATRGLNLAPVFLGQTKRLFRDADTAWIELTDFGYELSILGETRCTSSSLGEAVEELDAALLHGRCLPGSLRIIPIADGVWGVDMADLVRRARAALESL